MKKTYRIAAIPGDGIGHEVMPEGINVLQAAALRWDLDISFENIEWASCEYYQHHGQMMPNDWQRQLQCFDAIYFGAVGWPATVPDHISLWGSLLKFRRDFQQYVNLRPVRLFPGIPCPLVGKQPGDIDFMWFGKIPKVNIHRLAGVCLKAPSRKWFYRRRYSHAVALTVF